MKKKSTLITLIKTLWKYTKKELILNSIMSCISGFGGSLNIIFLGIFYSILENGNKLPANQTFFSCLICIISTLLIMLFISIIEEYYNNVIKPKIRVESTQKMEIYLFKKSKNIELKAFDDDKFYNSISWVMNNYVHKIYAILDNLASLSSFVVTLISSSIVLTHISPIVGLSVLVICLIGAFINHKKGKRNEEFEEKMVFANRKETYIESIFSSKACAKELRCSSIYSTVMNKYDDLLEEKRFMQTEHNQKMLWINLLSNLLLYLAKPIIYIYYFILLLF